MGKVVNITTLYDEWLKEVKIDLTTHSRQAGDSVPPVLLNFPAYLIAPKLGWGNTVPTITRQLGTKHVRVEQAPDQQRPETEVSLIVFALIHFCDAPRARQYCPLATWAGF
jgi:hypothetical protein